MGYVGEIRLFGGNFAPAGWYFCDGSLIPITENETLFQLIGTTYGGDGEATFALPDLRGRVPVHQGTGAGLSTYVLGERAGVESVTLTAQQIPAHTHPLLLSTAPGTADSPQGNLPATPPAMRHYAEDSASVSLAPTALAGAGGSQPHDNMQPYLGLNFIISAYGVFPSPT